MIDFELMPHQQEAVHNAQFETDTFLAWEPGTGKSCAAIQILRGKYMDAGRLKRTLILAPLITLKNWQNEIQMFSNVHKNAVYPLVKAAKRVQIIESLKDKPGILILNPDALSQPKVVAALMEWGPELMVLDEIHVFRSYKSKRAKVAALLADRAECRICLTGTPILNNALDLFMQFRILDGGATFGANYFAFRGRYFEDENAHWNSKPGHFPKWAPRPSTYKELQKIMDAKISRVLKKDVLKDLPDLVTEVRYVNMGTEQLKAYQEMKRDFVAYLKELTAEGTPKAVIAKLAITKSLRLQQIVSGAVNTENGGWHKFASVPRMEVLRELLLELTPNHKVIIWACFQANYAMIADLCTELDVGYTEIHGLVKNKDKYINQDKFNDPDSNVRVLIGNAASGGVGINLVASSYSIYYSRSTKLGDDLQSEARNHRKGSEIHEKITRINLVCPGSIDELIAEGLAGKLDISEAILDKGKI